MLSRCWSRAGFVIPLLYVGFDCDCVVETGLGLLSRCRSRAGFVIPLLEQGWVCYPAAVGLALIAIVWLRQGWVCYPAVGAGLGLLSRCWSRAGFVIVLYPAAGFVIPLSEVWL